MEIQIKKDEVEKIGNQIILYTNDFNSYIKRLISIIDNINSAWDGADALRYINIMREKYITKLEDLESILREYGEYLKNVPGAYSTLDESYSSKYIDV